MIQWTVTTPGKLVSLILRKGPGNNIGTVGPIADSIANNGSYLWNIPSTLPAGLDYAVQIIVGPASNVSNVGPDGYNFTPQLELKSNFTGNATITTSSSSISSAASASSGSGSASAPSSIVLPTLVTTSGTVPTGTGAAKTTGSVPTASSSATRVEGFSARGNGIFAFVVALAIGIAASF